MKKINRLILICATFLLFLPTAARTVLASPESGTPPAETAEASAPDNSVHYAQVIDDAGLFTQEQTAELTRQCQLVSDGHRIDVIILTTPNIPGSRRAYLEDYYDSRDTELTDSILLLLNMDPNDRGIEIQGYGSCETSFPDGRLDRLIDDVFPYLKDGDYFGAMTVFTRQVSYYMEQDASVHTGAPYREPAEPSAGPDPENIAVSARPAAKPLPHGRNAVIALIAAALSVSVMLYRSSGRMAAHQGTYLDSSSSRILGRYDRYIRTSTTRRAKPKPQESSGSHHTGGGISSGGHSHSGSGRSF